MNRKKIGKKLTEEKKKVVDEIKVKARKYKSAYINDHQELKQCKSKLAILEKQLKIFKERLQEEKEAKHIFSLPGSNPDFKGNIREAHIRIVSGK